MSGSAVSACGQSRHPIASDADSVPRSRDGVEDSGRSSAGGWRLQRGRRIALHRLALPIARPGQAAPSGPRTAQRKVAVSAEAREERIAGVGCEASASTPRDEIPSAAPLTTRCEVPHRVPKSTEFRSVQFCIGANSHWPREDQASVSPTPSVADPGVTTDRIAVSRDVAGLTKRSSMVRSISSALLLLYGLPLRRSLLLRSGFRLRLNLRGCLLRHIALLAKLSWRCRISAHANRRHCIPITTAQRKKQLPD